MSTESKIRSLLAADDLPRRLADALNETRSVRFAQSRMSPELSYGRHAGPAPATARQAAVLLLLFRRDHPTGGAGRWHLPLTERSSNLSRHGGQVSLPGGAIDLGESSREAALRELDEELGITGPLEMIGRLPDCYVFASDFVITPWVAATDAEPVWRPHDREVQGVIELPLETLLDETLYGRMAIVRGPLVFYAPCLRLGSVCIWGATSVILGEFAAVLESISASQ